MKRILPFVVWTTAFLLYVATAGPSIVEFFDDTLEFQLVAPTFGIAHPTGYPLYTLLGGIWTRLFPVGNWAWRLNIFSALCAATTILLLFLLARRLCPAPHYDLNQWAGAAAALTFGLGTVWWSQATVAEVYPLHLLLMAAIMTTAIGMNREIDGAGQPTQRFDRRMTLLLLLVGFGLAHHRTTVLLLPGLALYLFWSIPGIWRPRFVWWLWLIALLSPLLLYAYLPIRAAAGVRDLNASYVHDVNGFLDHVLARQFASFFRDNELAVSRNAGDWLTLMVGQMGLPALLLAAAGLVRVVDRSRRPVKAWIFVLTVLLTNLVFALFYRVGDVEVFLLPVFFCVALFTGAGVSLVPFITTNRRVAQAVEGVLVLVIVVSFIWPGSTINRRNDWAAHNLAVAMTSVAYPPSSVLLGLEGEVTAFKYMQEAENLGLTVEPIVANDPVERANMVATLVDEGRPVYLTREIAGIGDLYSFTGDGPLVRVWPRGTADVPVPSNPLNAAVDEGRLTLEGYDLFALHQAGDPALQLILYWRPGAPLDRKLKLSLRATDASGNAILAPSGTPLTVDSFPLRQAAMTTEWLEGELLSDVYFIEFPGESWSDAATLEMIVYDADTVAEVGRQSIDLTPLTGE